MTKIINILNKKGENKGGNMRDGKRAGSPEMEDVPLAWCKSEGSAVGNKNINARISSSSRFCVLLTTNNNVGNAYINAFSSILTSTSCEDARYKMQVKPVSRIYALCGFDQTFFKSLMHGSSPCGAMGIDSQCIGNRQVANRKQGKIPFPYLAISYSLFPIEKI